MSKEDCDAARRYVIENGIRTPLERILEDAVVQGADMAFEMAADRIRSTRMAEDAAVEAVVAGLPKRSKGPSIVRYLSRHPRGVTFGEFQMHRDEATGHRLTESDDFEVVAVMLRKLSGKVKPHGWTIEASPTANRIALRKQK
jgi:hypothetical protein